MTLKSLNFLALGNILYPAAALLSSTSHKATIFSLGILLQLAFPLPPTPITATLRRLVGGFFKKSGIKNNPVEAAVVDFINDLREKLYPWLIHSF